MAYLIIFKIFNNFKLFFLTSITFQPFQGPVDG